MNVFAIKRSHERAVEALDDLVSNGIALVLDLANLQRHIPGRRIGRQHAVEQLGCRYDAFG